MTFVPQSRHISDKYNCFQMKLLSRLKKTKTFLTPTDFPSFVLVGRGGWGRVEEGVFGDDNNKKFVHFLLLEIFLVIVNVNYCLFLKMKALSIQI
jgi:hypothetical protein